MEVSYPGWSLGTWWCNLGQLGPLRNLTALKICPWISEAEFLILCIGCSRDHSGNTATVARRTAARAQLEFQTRAAPAPRI